MLISRPPKLEPARNPYKMLAGCTIVAIKRDPSSP